MASCRIAFLLVFLPFAAQAEEEMITRQAPPIPAPILIYADETGQKQVPDFEKARLTVVHFWATWCTPCLEELPQIGSAAKAYGKNVQFIAISQDGLGKPERVKSFLKSADAENLTPYFDVNNGSFRAARLRGIPTTLFIDSKGQQIAVGEGPLEWESAEVVKFIRSVIKDKK